MGQGSILNFLWSAPGWKQGQKVGKVSVADQVLAIWSCYRGDYSASRISTSESSLTAFKADLQTH